jgi:hypothetical protein
MTRDRGSAWAAAMALGAVVGFAGCGPTAKPVIDARRQPCTQHCEGIAARPCVNLSSSSSSTFSTKEECVEQCTTVGGGGGIFDEMWGHDPASGQDECFGELSAQIVCMSALDDEAYCGRSDLPWGERPCDVEVTAVSDCMSAHERKGGGR